MITRMLHCALLVGALSFLASRAEAQSEPHLRNDCRLAAQVLTTGHPAPHYGWAAEIIPKCGEAGGSVLAQVWGRPPSDSVTLDWLYYASYTLRDKRITDAVAKAALDRSLPQLVRLNAIRVLTGHAVPSFMVSVADLSPVENDSVRVFLGGVSHVSVRQGAQPIGFEEVAKIVNTLAVLRNDSDGRVARVATYAYGQICGRTAESAPRGSGRK